MSDSNSSAALTPASAYASKDSAQDTADRMVRRATNDIKARVRKIIPAPAELFGKEWFDLSDVYQHVGLIAAMEEKDLYHNAEHYVVSTLLGTNVAPSKEQVGKDSSYTTVWEREDVCVRLIVEEGKTNLVVRTLEDFYALTAKGTASALQSIPSRLFEVCAGALVRCTMTALETLQTLDLRALISHCATVLDDRNSCGPSPVTKDAIVSLLTQHGAVIGYLAHIAVRFEKLRNEDAVFEQLLDLKIFDKVLAHAELYLPLLSSSNFRELVRSVSTDVEGGTLVGSFAHIAERDFPANYVIFFSAFLGSEHHKSNPAAVFPTKQEKQRFVTVMEPVTRLMMPGATVSMDLRKATRPLTDTILRFK